MEQDRTYFPFYWNWSDMINSLMDEDQDVEMAKMMALAIVRYASTGEIMDLGNRLAQRLFENTLVVGVDAAARHYADGCRGGRPKKISNVDDALIAKMRADHRTAKEIATCCGVSDKTILRTDGWLNYQEYTQSESIDNTPKKQTLVYNMRTGKSYIKEEKEEK